ncbi:unnamed protein product, partial [Rotaria magnacalcarata]
HMGLKYSRPSPCYHGYASLPPSKRSCCRFQPMFVIHTRAVPIKFGHHRCTSPRRQS